MIFVLDTARNDGVHVLFKFPEVTNVGTRKSMKTIWEWIAEELC